MPVAAKCVYKGCTSAKRKNRDLSFHRFPRDEAIRMAWIKRSGNPALANKSEEQILNVRMCSLHFLEDQFIPYGKKGKRTLRNNALPNDAAVTAPVVANNILTCLPISNTTFATTSATTTTVKTTALMRRKNKIGDSTPKELKLQRLVKLVRLEDKTKNQKNSNTTFGAPKSATITSATMTTDPTSVIQRKIIIDKSTRKELELLGLIKLAPEIKRKNQNSITTSNATTDSTSATISATQKSGITTSAITKSTTTTTANIVRLKKLQRLVKLEGPEIKRKNQNSIATSNTTTNSNSTSPTTTSATTTTGITTSAIPPSTITFATTSAMKISATATTAAHTTSVIRLKKITGESIPKEPKLQRLVKLIGPEIIRTNQNSITTTNSNTTSAITPSVVLPSAITTFALTSAMSTSTITTPAMTTTTSNTTSVIIPKELKLQRLVKLVGPEIKKTNQNSITTTNSTSATPKSAITQFASTSAITFVPISALTTSAITTLASTSAITFVTTSALTTSAIATSAILPSAIPPSAITFATPSAITFATPSATTETANTTSVIRLKKIKCESTPKELQLERLVKLLRIEIKTKNQKIKRLEAKLKNMRELLPKSKRKRS